MLVHLLRHPATLQLWILPLFGLRSLSQVPLKARSFLRSTHGPNLKLLSVHHQAGTLPLCPEFQVSLLSFQGSLPSQDSLPSPDSLTLLPTCLRHLAMPGLSPLKPVRPLRQRANVTTRLSRSLAILLVGAHYLESLSPKFLPLLRCPLVTTRLQRRLVSLGTRPVGPRKVLKFLRFHQYLQETPMDRIQHLRCLEVLLKRLGLPALHPRILHKFLALDPPASLTGLAHKFPAPHPPTQTFQAHQSIGLLFNPPTQRPAQTQLSAAFLASPTSLKPSLQSLRVWQGLQESLFPALRHLSVLYWLHLSSCNGGSGGVPHVSGFALAILEVRLYV